MARAPFIWDDYNETKIGAHYLAKREVEYAWAHDRQTQEYQHPKHGTYWETIGACPSGRMITIVWRWNVRRGIEGVYVITAY